VGDKLMMKYASRLGFIVSAISTKKLLRYVVFSFSIFLLSGCGSANSALKLVGLGSDNALSSVALESTADSNMDTPVAIDLLFIYDANVTPLLLALNGPEWFTRKPSLIKRYDKEIDVVSLEVVPLSFIKKIALPNDHKKAKNILMFTNYRSNDGQYVAELSHFKKLKIRLLNTRYELLQEGGK
jgi:type VI secretion system protein